MKKLSICVTSYSRVEELIRLLKSIDLVKYRNDIEVVIAEDKSPKREQIKQAVTKFKETSDLEIRDFYNENNLGYDRNLGNLIKLSKGEYILFSSDDDTFIPNALDSYLDTLFKKSPSLAYSPFKNGNFHKREYRDTFLIPSGWQNAAFHIDNAILFSGLTFKKQAIEVLNSEEFLNTYYFQVYMFLTVFSKHGALYINIPLVNAMNDGENGYGKSNSSVKNEFLQNRKSVFSILEFNKGLIKVIKLFDDRNNANVFAEFSRQYSLKSYYGLSRAKHQGKEVYKKYITMLDSLGVDFTWHNKVYRMMLAIFGANLSDSLMSIPRKMLIRKLANSKR